MVDFEFNERSKLDKGNKNHEKKKKVREVIRKSNNRGEI